MRVGLQIPSFTWPGGPAAIADRLRSIARTAEDAGFSSLWVMDHFFQLPEETGWDGPDRPMLEAYTTLGFLAASTNRVKLGALVTGVVYRHPGLLVKTATTLDVLAGGRAYLGIGAGWYEREAVGLGVPWPARGERFERLEETLRIEPPVTLANAVRRVVEATRAQTVHDGDDLSAVVVEASDRDGIGHRTGRDLLLCDADLEQRPKALDHPLATLRIRVVQLVEHVA